MPRAIAAWSVAVAAAVLAAPIAAQPKPESAAALLASARAAIGKPAAAVTSMRLAGVSQRRNGYFGRTPEAQEYITYTYEGFIQAPDKYLTVRRTHSGGVETRTGLSGQSLLNLTILPDGKQSSWQGEGALLTQQKEFARMMLLLLLRTDTASALKLQEPAGPNRSLRFIESDGSTALLHLDPKTNLPAELRYYVLMVRTGEIREHVMTVDERRTVGGVSFPVRISTNSLSKTDEVLVLGTVELNPTLPRDTFRIQG